MSITHYRQFLGSHIPAFVSRNLHVCSVLPPVLILRILSFSTACLCSSCFADSEQPLSVFVIPLS
jgi:hypothetical protein